MFEEQIFPAISPGSPAETEDTEKDAPDQEPDTAEEEESQEEKPVEESLIFGKYKNIEEAEKGFKELERTFGKKSTEAAQLRKELEQLRTPAAKGDEPEEDPLAATLKDSDGWMERFYKEGPKAVLDLIEKAVDKRAKPLEERVAATTYQEQVRQFREEHPDMDELADDMAEFFKAHPKFVKEKGALEIAYGMAKWKKLAETLPKIEEQGAGERAKADLDKKAARMPSGGRQKTKELSVEELVATSLLNEDRKARGIFG